MKKEQGKIEDGVTPKSRGNIVHRSPPCANPLCERSEEVNDRFFYRSPYRSPGNRGGKIAALIKKCGYAISIMPSGKIGIAPPGCPAALINLVRENRTDVINAIAMTRAEIAAVAIMVQAMVSTEAAARIEDAARLSTEALALETVAAFNNRKKEPSQWT